MLNPCCAVCTDLGLGDSVTLLVYTYLCSLLYIAAHRLLITPSSSKNRGVEDVGRGAELKCVRVRAALGTGQRLWMTLTGGPNRVSIPKTISLYVTNFGFAAARQYVLEFWLSGLEWKLGWVMPLCAIVGGLQYAHPIYTAARNNVELLARSRRFGIWREQIWSTTYDVQGFTTMRPYLCSQATKSSTPPLKEY